MDEPRALQWSKVEAHFPEAGTRWDAFCAKHKIDPDLPIVLETSLALGIGTATIEDDRGLCLRLLDDQGNELGLYEYIGKVHFELRDPRPLPPGEHTISAADLKWYAAYEWRKLG